MVAEGKRRTGTFYDGLKIAFSVVTHPLPCLNAVIAQILAVGDAKRREELLSRWLEGEKTMYGNVSIAVSDTPTSSMIHVPN